MVWEEGGASGDGRGWVMWEEGGGASGDERWYGRKS